MGMAKDSALTGASRETLLEVIAQQQALIVRLQRRVELLEGKAKPGGSQGMPGLKSKGKAGGGPAKSPGPRKPRPHGFARRRMAPTRRVEHALETCPGCGAGLAGGWAQRTREVIEVPLAPAQVTEHVFIARNCPACGRRRVPQASLGEAALGKQRLGANLVSLIASLREEGRLPVRTIQWYLDAVHGLSLSLGAIVQATERVARQAQAEVADILERIRGSPVVHADETGWRQDGSNGYVWSFSTPKERYFLWRGRNKEVVDEVLGDDFAGVPVSDFYAAYHHYDGPKQRCRAHLLRDIHDLKTFYPKDAGLARWAAGVRQVYEAAQVFTHPQPQQRQQSQQALERKLLALGRPSLEDPAAVQGRLFRRIERHIKELFVFVAELEVPPDNNAA